MNEDDDSREYKFTLRVPAVLWRKLNERAEINRRSLNSEILVILERVAMTGEFLTEEAIVQWMIKRRPDLILIDSKKLPEPPKS